MIVRMSVRALAALAVVLLVNLSAQAQPAPSRLDEIVKRGSLRVVSMEDGSFKKIYAAWFD